MQFSQRDIALELVRRKRLREAIHGELHERQLRVVAEENRFIAMLCGRRAGKTELLARLIALALIDAGHNEWVVYAARTLSIARDLIWAHLVRINESHQLGWKMYEQKGMLKTPTGARFRVLGVDKKPEIQKIRGYKLRLAIFDEASTYQEHLEEAVKDCAEPALFDLRGKLILSGTPGVVCDGYWYEASTGTKPKGAKKDWKPKYAVHSWTVRENPLLGRDVEEALREVREDNGWEEDDPTYQREYMGEWVEDPSALVYKFVAKRNTCEKLPEEFDPKTWLCTLGIDFGMTDECAWCVLGSPRHSKDIYVLHVEKHSELLPDQAAAITATLIEKYRPVRIVGDGGGVGKPYVQEFNRRWAQGQGITVSLAEKVDKVGAISLLNGDLRGGGEKKGHARIKLLLPASEELAREVKHLPWLDAAHTKENPSFPNHAADAFLYAWRSHTSYWHRPKKPELTDAEKRVQEMRRRARKKQEQGRDPWFKRRRPAAEAVPLPLAA